MSIEMVRAAYETRPFQPFILHLADGRSLSVLSPEFMSMFPSGRMIIIIQPDNSYNLVDLLLVTDLEFKPISASGKRRK